jgi:hypothetical protein
MPFSFTGQDQKNAQIPFVFLRCVRLGSILLLLVTLSGILGCVTDGRYREEHEIKQLNVVFVDQQTLHEEWKNRTGRSGVQFMLALSGGASSVKTLRGFFDFTTNTLYCPKWNFAVCGHELHHAALGQFHDKE